MSADHILPQGWAQTTVGQVAEVNPRVDLTAVGEDTPVSFVRMAAVEEESGHIDVSQVRPLSEVRRGYTVFRDGDVLFAKITPCMENGKSAVARGLSSGIGFGSTEFHVLRPREGVDADLLRYFLAQKSYRDAARSSMTGTAGQLRVPAAYLSNTLYPLPPLAEQRRIVAAIEEQFTRLDAGVAALKRAQAALKRYRAAVLKAAVEGKLTAAWRTRHPDVRPASELLADILAERRARWEADLRAKGKDPAKARYEEPQSPQTEELPELPQGWVWATAEQLASPEPRSLQSGPFGSALHHAEFQDAGVLAIGIDNVLEGQFSMGREHRISLEKYQELARFTARPLDVLVTVMATVGRCCIVPADLETAIITKHVYRITLNRRIGYPYFVMYALQGGSEVRKQLFGQVQGQTRPGINGEILRRIALPIPPLPEQEVIVSEIEQRLSVVNVLEATIADNLKRAERLRQAILERAFTGRLVPQDREEAHPGSSKRIASTARSGLWA